MNCEVLIGFNSGLGLFGNSLMDGFAVYGKIDGVGLMSDVNGVEFCVVASRVDQGGGGPRRVRGSSWSSCRDRDEA